ncbi:MAG TPA: universal stress protein [Solirubrobacteraceae bacterium]|nr:universal stress protein [Solirubrobacteraceae bacterium]
MLLASEERPIDAAAIAVAARLALPTAAPVYVFSVARVHGTSFGLPNPGLLPTRQEWDAQRASVRTAVEALRARGVPSEGRVVGTRGAAKAIVREAERMGCDAIVMGADPPRSAWVADFLWSQEPQRVQRRARIPVYLVSPG